jgi:hypothetical protein
MFLHVIGEGALARLGLAGVLAVVGCGCRPAPPGVAHPRPCETARSDDAGLRSCVELVLAERPELVHGPQGGWHVELGVRMEVESSEDLILVYGAQRERDGAQIGSLRLAVEPRRLRSEPPYLVREGDLLIFDVASAAEVALEPVTITATLERSGAVIGTDRRQVSLESPR